LSPNADGETPDAPRITLKFANNGERTEMNMKSIAYAAVLGGAIAFAAMAGGTSQAEAAGFKSMSNPNSGIEKVNVQKVGGLRGRRFRRSRFRHFNGFHGDRFHGNRFHGCGFYQWKWHATRSFFWKKKFFLCKGWW
jgi:hypothetical protein